MTVSGGMPDINEDVIEEEGLKEAITLKLGIKEEGGGEKEEGTRGKRNREKEEGRGENRDREEGEGEKGQREEAGE